MIHKIQVHYKFNLWHGGDHFDGYYEFEHNDLKECARTLKDEIKALEGIEGDGDLFIASLLIDGKPKKLTHKNIKVYDFSDISRPTEQSEA